jgi:hypothetical protein
MEGGIAVILILIIVVIAAVLGVALYVTGGALWFGKTSRKGDRIEGEEADGRRPEHKAPTNESIENTKLVGTRQTRERDGDNDED